MRQRLHLVISETPNLKPLMTIEITNKSGELVPTDQVRALLTQSLVQLKLNPECEVNLVFVDENEMTELHIKWMDEPGPTDVLSFPMDMPETEGEIVTLGDIMISPFFAATQAQAAGHSAEHEIFILATHGLLHIIGYDHAEPEEERIMFALQESIVENWKKTQ